MTHSPHLVVAAFGRDLGRLRCAAAAGHLVVVSVPVAAFPYLPGASLAGKTVIDTCNYGPERDGPISELDDHSLTSSELLLRYPPGAAVVKAFNNIFWKHMESLARPAGRSTADSCRSRATPRKPKTAVTGFLDSIGYGVVDAGSLANSWRQATGPPVMPAAQAGCGDR